MSNFVLWVEDDPDDALLIGRAIRKAGLDQPILARDGREAVDYLTGAGPAAHPYPSLILLDLKLPRMSGFEVLIWIREQPEIHRVPVIIFTSSKEKSDVDRAYDLGANAYLLKSVDHADLVTALKRVHAFWMDLNVNPTPAVREIAASASQSGSPGDPRP